MTQTLHLSIVTAPHGKRNPTLRIADMLEVFAQDLRDQASGSPLVNVPGYKITMNGDTLEVLNELP